MKLLSENFTHPNRLVCSESLSSNISSSSTRPFREGKEDFSNSFWFRSGAIKDGYQPNYFPEVPDCLSQVYGNAAVLADFLGYIVVNPKPPESRLHKSQLEDGKWSSSRDYAILLLHCSELVDYVELLPFLSKKIAISSFVELKQASEKLLIHFKKNTKLPDTIIVNKCITTRAQMISWIKEYRFVVEWLLEPFWNAYSMNNMGRFINMIRSENFSFSLWLNKWGEKARASGVVDLSNRLSKLLPLSRIYELKIEPSGDASLCLTDFYESINDNYVQGNVRNSDAFMENIKGINFGNQNSYDKNINSLSLSQRYALSVLLMTGVRIATLFSLFVKCWFDYFTIKYKHRRSCLLVSAFRNVSFISPILPNVTCQFLDICPEIFNTIRTRNGISKEDYMSSICRLDFSKINFISDNNFSYFSIDRRYLIRRIDSLEAKFIFGFLPEYLKYTTENPDTMLAALCGLHCISKVHPTTKNKQPMECIVESVSNIYFLVVRNVFDPLRGVHHIYEIKGSRAMANVDDMLSSSRSRHGNDSDWIQSRRKLWLPLSKKEKLLRIYNRDCEFLCLMNITNYTFIFGIHAKRHANSIDSRKKISSIQPQQTSALLNAIVARKQRMTSKMNKSPFSLFIDNLAKTPTSHVEVPEFSASQDKSEAYYFGIINFTEPPSKKTTAQSIRRLFSVGNATGEKPQDYRRRQATFIQQSVINSK